jgi:hypothetical protein
MGSSGSARQVSARGESLPDNETAYQGECVCELTSVNDSGTLCGE